MANDMTEAEFNSIIDGVAKIYAPIVKAKGKTLVMIKNWADGTVNAYAEQVGNKWKVSMFGGLARHKYTTNDGFAMVVCHELGHHLGGLPKYGDNDWASIEGQSDYWGTLKCFRKLVEKDDNGAIVKKLEVDAYAQEMCKKVYSKDAKLVAVCTRSAMGGLSLGTLLGDLGGTLPINYNTPDTNVVDQTAEEHPAAQCRLDTYLAASLCKRSAYTDVSDTDINAGVCYQGTYLQGVRPLCWFKP